jgi:hypothetical protein
MNLLLLRPNTINFAVPLVLNGMRKDSRVKRIYQFPPNVREARRWPNWNTYYAGTHYDEDVLSSETEVRRKIEQGEIQAIIGTTRYFNLMGKPGQHLTGYLKYLYKYAFPFSIHRNEIGSSFILEWKDLIQSRKIPAVIIDCRDNFMIRDEDVELLRLADLFYKREVPFNRFNMFRSSSESLFKTELHDLSVKPRPISIGIDDGVYHQLKSRRCAKESDIFWCGKINSSQRLGLSDKLHSLATRHGWTLDAPESNLSEEEFYRRIALSRVCISVEGAGWDCYRHYESIALGTIPLMNQPTVDASGWSGAPDACFFKNDFSDLEAKISSLLGNPSLQSKVQEQLENLLQNELFWSVQGKRILDDIHAL